MIRRTDDAIASYDWHNHLSDYPDQPQKKAAPIVKNIEMIIRLALICLIIKLTPQRKSCVFEVKKSQYLTPKNTNDCSKGRYYLYINIVTFALTVIRVALKVCQLF